MGNFERAVSIISSMIKYFCAGLLLIMLLLGTADVLGRYLFNSPILGALEVLEILLPALVLIGLAYTQLSDRNIKVEIIISHLAPRLQAIIGFIISIWVWVLFILIGWRGLLIAISDLEQGRKILNIDILIFYPKLLITLCALFMFPVLALQTIRFFNKMKGAA